MSSREIEKYVVLSVEPMLSVQRASAKRRLGCVCLDCIAVHQSTLMHFTVMMSPIT